MKQITYRQGQIICRQGEMGNCMFNICSGSVTVYSQYGTENEQKLAELKADECFGEMELIENAPRSATVVAMEDTVLDVITEDSFLDYFEENPERVFLILKQLSQRLRKTTGDYLDACREIYENVEHNVPFDPELNARLIAIESEYMMFNMSGLRFY